MTGIDTQLWFAPEDEKAFSDKLIKLFPKLVFINWLREFTPTPPIRPSLELCDTQYVKLWNLEIYPSWPEAKPIAGLTARLDALVFRRSTRMNYVGPSGDNLEVLTSGSLGWGGGEPGDDGYDEMRLFALKAIELVESMHTGILLPLGRRVDQVREGGVNGYSVGPEASRWCNGGENRALKVNAGPHLYASIHMG